MSAKRVAKRARRERRAANMHKYKTQGVAPPPSEREADTSALLDKIIATANVKDIPLALLQIHSCHGDRNPYLDTPDGNKRRLACDRHIRDAGGFDVAACHILTVSVHADDTYWIIDGLGRLYMADQLSGGLVTALPCRLLFGLNAAQERALFERMGTQNTKVSPYDVWRSKISARGEDGEEVRGIVAIREKFGANMPKITLGTLRFGWATLAPKSGERVLERAVAIVANTALGADRRYSSVAAAAVIALLGTQPHFNETRFREIVDTDEGIGARLLDRAQRKANSLGYTKPHARTVAWIMATQLAADYNHRLAAGNKLDASKLDDLECAFPDAYSTAPPKATPKKAAA